MISSGFIFSRRDYLYASERMIKFEYSRRDKVPVGANVKTFWTIQGVEEISQATWHILLQQDAIGVLRGWYGERKELDTVLTIFQAIPKLLPSISTEEFFANTNFPIIRPQTASGKEHNSLAGSGSAFSDTISQMSDILGLA